MASLFKTKEEKTPQKVTNLIIVDASGSMSSRIDEVKGGLKQLFVTIREDQPEQNVIVVDFSGAGDIRTLVNVSNTKDLKDEVADNYSTRGMTALFDAVAYAFNLVPKDQDKVFVTIITDGEENDSKEFSRHINGAGPLKKMIKTKRKEGWAILFMGTDDSCIKNAVDLGISYGNVMTYNAGGGYSGFSGMMGYTGYSGTAAYARTAYMSSATGTCSDTLLMEAETLRNITDANVGFSGTATADLSTTEAAK